MTKSEKDTRPSLSSKVTTPRKSEVRGQTPKSLILEHLLSPPISLELRENREKSLGLAGGGWGVSLSRTSAAFVFLWSWNLAHQLSRSPQSILLIVGCDSVDLFPSLPS